MQVRPKRRSRMHRHSSGKRIELTPRDLEIFRLLSRYRYLRSTVIHVFIGGDKTKLVERLGRLYHDGRYINRPPQQWQMVHARYRPAVYELDDAGHHALGSSAAVEMVTWLGRGREGVHRQFAHSLMICEILSAVELDIRSTPSLRFISWQEILRHPRCLERAHTTGAPFAISGGHNSESDALMTVVPDALFGIEYTGADKRAYRFFALEADRGTMPVTRSTLRQTSYFRKLQVYQNCIERQTYKTQLGLPNLFVLTVASNTTHMSNIMNLLTSAAASKFFLFKLAPGTGPYDQAPLARANMVKGPWQRVGLEPLSIDRP